MSPEPRPAAYSNRLLRRLSPDDLGLFEARLERVEMTSHQPLEDANQPIEHAFFLERGMASVVAVGDGDRRVEVGVVGWEGVTALMVVLGSDRSPNDTMVQISGEAMRLRAADLRSAMDASPTLRNLLLRYSQAFLIQTSYTALANGRAKLEERLARWLLMAHDRVEGDELPLVHEFLALMLGVRRPGVTVALHILEGQALIRASRGKITVLDRQGLEQAASGLYGVPEREYERLMAA
jgi:CRP-like cAMP-binding protein